MKDSRTEKFSYEPQELLGYLVEALKKMNLNYRISTEGVMTGELARIIDIAGEKVRVIILPSNSGSILEIKGESDLTQKIIYELVKNLPRPPWNLISKRRWIKRWPILKGVS